MFLCVLRCPLVNNPFEKTWLCVRKHVIPDYAQERMLSDGWELNTAKLGRKFSYGESIGAVKIVPQRKPKKLIAGPADDNQD